MKTALRTYHPVPSLQKTDGNAQDAPRIKNCLKAAVLPSEIRTVSPSTPDEVLARLVCTVYFFLILSYSKKRAGQRPSTSVVNLVFVLANHAAVRDLCVAIFYVIETFFFTFALASLSTSFRWQSEFLGSVSTPHMSSIG